MEVTSDAPNRHLNHTSFNCCQTILHIFYRAMKTSSYNQSMIVSQNFRTTKLNKHNVILITNINFSNCCVLILLVLVANLFRPVAASKNSIHYNYNYKVVNQLVRVIYQAGIGSEESLPECESWSVCNKIDTYSSPWIEKQCRCRQGSCSTSLDPNDGYTMGDKSRQLKLCEPVDKLPTCRYFRDITWTLTSNADNTTTHKVNCVCPKNSVAYIFKHQIFKTSKVGVGYKYHFACSPETKLRCQRKEPCRLFTVRKRPDVEEVNTNTLCQCPQGYTCPTHHKNANVVAGTVYSLDHIRTYSGYCAKPVKSDLFASDLLHHF